MALPWTLGAAALAKVVAAAAYIYVGSRVVRMESRGPHRLAVAAFGVFWFGLATVSLVRGIADFASQADLPLEAFVVVRHLTLAALAAALGGFAYYVGFVYSGRKRLAWAVVAYYAIVTPIGHALVVASRPIGLAVGTWTVDLTYAQPSSWFTVLLVVLLGAPAVAAAVGYFALHPRFEKDSPQRKRVQFVGASLTLWLAAALLARLAEGDLMQFVARPLMGLAAAGCAVFAYAPQGRARVVVTSSLKQRARDLV